MECREEGMETSTQREQTRNVCFAPITSTLQNESIASFWSLVRINSDTPFKKDVFPHNKRG